MELIEWILKDENLKAAIKAVKGNKGAAGIDKMPVEELDGYFAEHGEEIKAQIRAKKYKPQPVRRVYIPKANGKQRPLGIPTVLSERSPVPTCERLLSAICLSCSCCFWSSRRERSIARALALFWNCERSFWHSTTVPVGRWVILTADEVLLMC